MGTGVPWIRVRCASESTRRPRTALQRGSRAPRQMACRSPCRQCRATMRRRPPVGSRRLHGQTGYSAASVVGFIGLVEHGSDNVSIRDDVSRRLVPTCAPGSALICGAPADTRQGRVATATGIDSKLDVDANCRARNPGHE